MQHDRYQVVVDGKPAVFSKPVFKRTIVDHGFPVSTSDLRRLHIGESITVGDQIEIVRTS